MDAAPAPTPDPDRTPAHDPAHDPASQAWLTPQVAVERFFAIEAARVTARTVHLYDRVVQRLDAYLASTDVDDWIGEHAAALLEAERQFAPRGAFLRLFGLDGLVFCLPGFLGPAWLAPSPSERRAQISLTGRLLDHLRRRRLIDLGEVACAFYEARQAVQDARDAT